MNVYVPLFLRFVMLVCNIYARASDPLFFFCRVNFIPITCIRCESIRGSLEALPLVDLFLHYHERSLIVYNVVKAIARQDDKVVICEGNISAMHIEECTLIVNTIVNTVTPKEFKLVASPVGEYFSGLYCCEDGIIVYSVVKAFAREDDGAVICDQSQKRDTEYSLAHKANTWSHEKGRSFAL